MKRLLIFLTTFLVLTNIYGQKELELYKKIYKTADSLKTSEKTNQLDSIYIYKVANGLDKKHPSEFFKVSGELVANYRFNEASFIYYLGLMRYRYYNSANPNYKISEDGALLGSLKSVIGEPINMYLRTDIDNFISIIKLAINYYSNNDSKFFSKEKNKEKFEAQIKSYKDLILELETNKEKYREQWLVERKTLEENLNKIGEK